MKTEIDTADASKASAQFQWDRITAIMAVLIGACALVVSLYTAVLQRAQVRAQTWPYLQLWQSNTDRSFSISNRGVGPARVVDVKIEIDKKEFASFDQIYQYLSKTSQPANSMQSYFAKRVLTANEDVKMIQFETDADFAVFMQNRDRIKFKICYCSVLDECYVLDENAPNEAQYIRSVPQCPVGKPGIFR